MLFYLHGNQLCHSLACHTVAGKDVRIVHLKKLSLKNIKIDKNEEIILSSDTPNSENLEVVCVWLVPSLLPLLVGRHETVQRPSLVFPHFFLYSLSLFPHSYARRGFKAGSAGSGRWICLVTKGLGSLCGSEAGATISSGF